MRLVLMGPPGAGKGTQGDRLAEALDVPRYATGDMLRAARHGDTELGGRAAEYMDAGELVPDEVVLGIVREVLASEEASDGFVLDGFPRTVGQAERLEAILDDLGTSLDAVAYLDVPEEELVRRLSSRRVCSECGEVTSAGDGEACGECGGDLVQREDDRPGTVRRRLEVYRDRTEPVLAWYRDEPGAPLTRVDGTGTIDQVAGRLRERLEL